MKTSSVKIVSDGTAAGTYVLMPDGTDIAKKATRIEIVVEQGSPVRATLTFEGARLDMVTEAENNGRN